MPDEQTREEKLRQESRILRGALRFYASRSVWMDKRAGDDLGERARRALEESAQVWGDRESE